MNFDKFTNDTKKNNWNILGVEVYENSVLNSVLTHSYGDTYDIVPKAITMEPLEQNIFAIQQITE